MWNKFVEILCAMESGIFPIGGTVFAAIFMAIVSTL